MYHTTALSFLKKGYQVIPLSKETGRPIIKFADIEITEDIIKSINWRNCDYALLMRGMWCIDIDTHAMDEQLAQALKRTIELCGIEILSVIGTDQYDNGLDGYSSIIKHEMKDELIKNFKNTFHEITSSGGLHVLFKKRDDIQYSQKIDLIKGVDIKAHPNNFVKIFPSDGRKVLNAVKELPYYDGEFEQTIFAPPKIITNYFSESVVRGTKGNHEGRMAYDRIISGTSNSRNADLFKAACWAMENGYSIDELYCVVGTIKKNDVFTQTEFDLTMESAKRRVNYVTVNRT